MTGRALRVTNPICSRIDQIAGPKIRIVALSFAELEMVKQFT